MRYSYMVRVWSVNVFHEDYQGSLFTDRPDIMKMAVRPLLSIADMVGRIASAVKMGKTARKGAAVWHMRQFVTPFF